jgi:hypothetical protein
MARAVKKKKRKSKFCCSTSCLLFLLFNKFFPLFLYSNPVKLAELLLLLQPVHSGADITRRCIKQAEFDWLVRNQFSDILEKFLVYPVGDFSCS